MMSWRGVSRIGSCITANLAAHDDTERARDLRRDLSMQAWRGKEFFPIDVHKAVSRGFRAIRDGVTLGPAPDQPAESVMFPRLYDALRRSL
jgi:hypothetical protein